MTRARPSRTADPLPSARQTTGPAWSTLINVAGVEAGLAEALGKLEADLLSRHQGPGQEQRLALCRLEFAHLASDIVARVEQGLTLQELERLGPAGRFYEGVNGPS
ncbi:MAG: hypothetical protein JWP29_5540 [Rhodoferax sp.]|nr:hypothetical protein [Rhodoferax sp.]